MQNSEGTQVENSRVRNGKTTHSNRSVPFQLQCNVRLKRAVMARINGLSIFVAIRNRKQSNEGEAKSISHTIRTNIDGIDKGIPPPPARPHARHQFYSQLFNCLLIGFETSVECISLASDTYHLSQ